MTLPEALAEIERLRARIVELEAERAMMLGSLAALGWSVWRFALHGRLIP